MFQTAEDGVEIRCIHPTSLSSTFKGNPEVATSLRDAKMATILPPPGTALFRQFTRQSLATIERLKEEAMNAPDAGAPEEEEPPAPNPDLEAGKSLPMIFGDPPSELLSTPLEDLDPYYKTQKVSQRPHLRLLRCLRVICWSNRIPVCFSDIRCRHQRKHNLQVQR